MFTNLNGGLMMHCSGPKFVSPSKHLLTRGGPTLYGNFIPTKRFIRFGIFSVMLMAAMQVYVLIISCLVRISAADSLLPVSTVMYADGKKQPTMPPVR